MPVTTDDLRRKIIMSQLAFTQNTRDLVLCSLFSALIAVGAFIKIPIPVVSFTLQFLFTTLSGLLLGARLGALSVAIYLITGLIGLPVFANGGGLSYILQPSFGYLIGFCLGSYITGTMASMEGRLSFWKLFSAGVAGLIAVYSIGMIYYYVIANFYIDQPIGIMALFLYCFLLPVPGDLVICIVSAIIAKRIIPSIRVKGGR
jgi:biotin transport system substrate-specific component